MSREPLEIFQSGLVSIPVDSEPKTTRIVDFGRALSDPIRLRMLGMMAAAAKEGRGCCKLPDCGVPAEDRDVGICACEFESSFGMSQSKVSYHLGKLKEAGLVQEERRGKWNFYALDSNAARRLLEETASHLGVSPDESGASLIGF